MDIDLENYISQEPGSLSPVVVLATIVLIGTIVLGSIYRLLLFVL
ncbi:MAG: hypothetical protein A07HR60_02290 [uncultured archaeon A07HR60]|jgi:hypothetical protein|nr:MAG: hypothetical protein A07HR60_02290 [uncultured archaeon A07HR60]